MVQRVAPSAASVAELRGVSLAIKAASRDTRRAMNAATRDIIGPTWKQEIAARSQSPMDNRIINTGVKIQGGNPASAIAGDGRRPLSNGLVPTDKSRQWEFGAVRKQEFVTYGRMAPSGTIHAVTRRTKRQIPLATRKGRIVYPAFAELGPRMVTLWVKIIVKKIGDAIDGK